LEARRKIVDLGGGARSVVRYRLLDTTRAYSQGKLDDAKERDSTASAHAEYLCGIPDGEGSQAFVEHDGNRSRRIEMELSDTGDNDAGAALAASLARCSWTCRCCANASNASN